MWVLDFVKAASISCIFSDVDKKLISEFSRERLLLPVA